MVYSPRRRANVARIRSRTSSGWSNTSARIRTVPRRSPSHTSSAARHMVGELDRPDLDVASTQHHSAGGRTRPRRRSGRTAARRADGAGGVAPTSAHGVVHGADQPRPFGLVPGGQRQRPPGASTRANSAAARSGRPKCRIARFPTTASIDPSSKRHLLGVALAEVDSGVPSPRDRHHLARHVNADDGCTARRAGRGDVPRPAGHVQHARSGGHPGCVEQRSNHPPRERNEELRVPRGLGLPSGRLEGVEGLRIHVRNVHRRPPQPAGVVLTCAGRRTGRHRVAGLILRPPSLTHVRQSGPGEPQAGAVRADRRVSVEPEPPRRVGPPGHADAGSGPDRSGSSRRRTGERQRDRPGAVEQRRAVRPTGRRPRTMREPRRSASQIPVKPRRRAGASGRASTSVDHLARPQQHGRRLTHGTR